MRAIKRYKINKKNHDNNLKRYYYKSRNEFKMNPSIQINQFNRISKND